MLPQLRDCTSRENGLKSALLFSPELAFGLGSGAPRRNRRAAGICLPGFDWDEDPEGVGLGSWLSK